MQHKLSARDRIIASAKHLFGARGFHQTAMADLAGEAQVSVGTIYRSFSSKSEIIRAIIMADTQETLGALQGDIDKIRDGVDRGEALEGMVLRFASKPSDALGHEIVAEGHRNPELAELIACVCGQFREQFRELARLLQPEAGEVQVEGVSELMLACLFGMSSREFTHPRLDEPQTAAVVSRMILKTLEEPVRSEV